MYFSVLEARRPRSRCSEVWFLLRPVSLACRQPPPLCVLRTSFTLIHPDCLYKGPISKHSCLLRSWGLGLEHTNLEDGYSSAHDILPHSFCPSGVWEGPAGQFWLRVSHATAVRWWLDMEWRGLGAWGLTAFPSPHTVSGLLQVGSPCGQVWACLGSGAVYMAAQGSMHMT